jgi:hypothetical protein
MRIAFENTRSNDSGLTPSQPAGDEDDDDGEADHPEREVRDLAGDLAPVELVEDVGEDEGQRERQLADAEDQRVVGAWHRDLGELAADEVAHQEARQEDGHQVEEQGQADIELHRRP